MNAQLLIRVLLTGVFLHTGPSRADGRAGKVLIGQIEPAFLKGPPRNDMSSAAFKANENPSG